VLLGEDDGTILTERFSHEKEFKKNKVKKHFYTRNILYEVNHVFKFSP
jgi:hypothetical protein